MQNNGFGNDERLRHWQKAGVFFLAVCKNKTLTNSDIYKYIKTKKENTI